VIEKYQTLHFADNIDVRTMQRCGGTTMRHVWKYLNTGQYTKMSLSEREAQYHLHGVSGYGFREGSYRITIIRDQVERLISAAAYRGYGEDINTVLENIEDYDDHHFASYTSRLGTPDMYDQIVDLTGIDMLVVSLGATHYHTNHGSYTPVSISDKAMDSMMRRYDDDIRNGWWKL
tara:strand:+ start:148 stop:675 length:528 start_codon:yes stop_codon:yes gene_type:complete